MKRVFRYFAALAATATAVIACQKEIDAPVEGEYTYTFALSSPETKAVLDSDENSTFTRWESGDQLGVYTNGAAGVSYNRYGSISIDENPVVFQISSYYALGAGDDVYCYFPYVKSNSQNPNTVNLEIPTIQKGKMNAMPMVSVPYTMTKAVEEKTYEPIADINMRNLGGVFQFNIFSSNADYQTETIEKVEFNANAALAGTFVYDITQEELSAISGLTETSITVDEQSLAVATSKETASKVLMVVAPGTHNGSLVVTTDIAIYTINFSSAKTVERSHVKPLNVDLSKAVSREVRPFDPTESVTKTMEEIVSENEYTVSTSENKVLYTSLSLNDVVTMSTTGQADCGSFWNTTSGTDWRLYQAKGGNLTLSVKEGYKIISASIKYNVSNTGTLKIGEETILSETAIASAKGKSSITLIVDNTKTGTTNGQVRVQSVTVAYTSSEIEKDDATWSVEPSAISVMEGKTATAVFTTDYNGTLNIVSDDAETATVSVEGNTITVSGVKEGTTTLSVSGEATDAYKAISKTIDVIVEKKVLVDPSVTIDSETTVIEGETKELKFTTNYNGAINVESGSTEIATAVYENGKVKITGVAEGNTTVSVSGEETADYKAFSKDITVTVEAAPKDEVYFYESFNTNDGTGGNDGSWSGSIATNTLKYDNTGWSVVSGNGADKCAKIGAGSTLGSATTPELDIKTSTAKLKFKAAAWGSSDSKKLKLSIASGTANLSVPSVEMAYSEWGTFYVDLTNISGKIKIKFEGNGKSNSRFFLDEVYVYYGEEPIQTRTLSSLEWTDYTSSYEKDANFVVDGTIKAVYDNGEKMTLTSSDVKVSSQPDMSVVGSTTAVISYTEGSVTKTATANITVTDERGSGSGTYTITFKTNTSDGTTTIAANTPVANVVSNGAEYVGGFTSSCAKAYLNCISGVKLGSGSASGILELTLADKYKNAKVKSITVKSAKYGSDTGTLTLSNGSSKLAEAQNPGTDFTYTFTTAQTISSIKLATSTKRAYISEIIITVE